MKKINIFFVISIVSVIIMSCNKETYEAPKSNTVAMSGRWWVELYGDADKSGLIDPAQLFYAYADFGGYGFVTSNTAANDVDSMILDDIHESWPFKVKLPVDVSGLTFKPATITNLHPDKIGETVTIINGKILKGAARSKSGAVVDSIFIEFEFSDDAGSYYIYSGHRDTGQPEDQFE